MRRPPQNILRRPPQFFLGPLTVMTLLALFSSAMGSTLHVHEADDFPSPRPPLGHNPADPPLSDEQATANEYLQQFGYVSPKDLFGRAAPGAALRRFQRFAGIAITGQLDTNTMDMMAKPRCGVKDWDPEDLGFESDFSRRRRRRFARHGTKWNHFDITYRIERYTQHLPRPVVDATIAKALKFWSDVSRLTFRAKPTGNVDIRIVFQGGRHGDDEAFDGRGGVLAHAYFPFDNVEPLWGDAHFDDAETWTVRSHRGQNLLYVAVHEFGHSLGLKHSDVRGAIMWPWAGEYIPGLKLESDDITGIQLLYGAPSDPAPPDPSFSAPPVPPTDVAPPLPPRDHCTGRIDAIDVASDGNVYAFNRALVYRLDTDGVVGGFPKVIRQVFPGAPAYVDAVLTVAEWDATYLFKGKQYWRYSDDGHGSFVAARGYPMPLTKWGFTSSLSNIDAAFQWGKNNKIYFIKGNHYWEHDRRRLSRRTALTTGWRGLPAYGVAAAMKWTNGRTYFYSKSGVYYRWDDDEDAVDTSSRTPYPRKTARWWFGCKA